MTPIDVSGRVTGIADGLAALDDGRGVDAILVSDLTNIGWLTGFSGSNGWVIVKPDELVLVTDGRYGAQAERQLDTSGAGSGLPTRIEVGSSGAQMLALVGAALGGVGRLAFESAHVSHQQFVSYAEQFAVTLVATVGVIEHGRRRKTPAEIERIEHACRIADQALADVASCIVAGVTEEQVRNVLEIRMRELGASGPSYETIVAAGPVNAPLPHHRPTSTPLEVGHTVVIDVGALFDGYHSDMTRTFVIGQPTVLQQQVYDVVLAAQCAGVAAVRPGVVARDLDTVCRGLIADAGFGPWFSHGTGHGVGLLIHEAPFVNASSEVELQVGDVVTVEPGVYRGDFGGVRVEDLVEVTSTGCRVLTRSPKDSLCLPLPRTN